MRPRESRGVPAAVWFTWAVLISRHLHHPPYQLPANDF
jgi:hypothetical protein